MADREKVIKGLECCKNKTCDYARPDVVCPYIEWSGEYETARYECTKRLAYDVLSLLKAQEPRVMTMEEVLNTGHDWVVCEFRYGVEVSKHSTKLVKYWANGVKYKYGQTWRCWTSRPTDEQRELVKWDD